MHMDSTSNGRRRTTDDALPALACSPDEAAQRTGLAGSGRGLEALLARDLPDALIAGPNGALIDLGTLVGEPAPVVIPKVLITERGELSAVAR